MLPVKKSIETLFYIPNKAGEIVPFKLNPVQDDFIRRRTFRMNVLKARQEGITSVTMAWYLIECMKHYCRAVMIAHDSEHTKKLLHRARFYLETMNGPKPKIGRENDQEIYFPKTHATFSIGTAGSKTFGRSDTITHLHCSELAFWRDPKTLLTGLTQAIPHETGIIVIESTANGYGSYHHKQYMKALAGESRFEPIFYSWAIFPEYQSRTPLTSALTIDEIDLIKKYDLTEAQIQWRREKVDEFEGDETLFKQEYPINVEEAFRTTGGSLFPQVDHVPSSMWSTAPSPFGRGKVSQLSNHPMKDWHYVAGINVAGVTGNDYSTVQILCVETREQVLAYRTNVLSPPEFAQVVAGFGEVYGAFLVPEQNQHGLSLIGCLKEKGYYSDKSHRIYRSKITQTPFTSVQRQNQFGFRTTATSKYPLIGQLLQHMHELILYDEYTVDQLRGFGEIESQKGDSGVITKLGNLDSTGHDDDVIALALACEGLRKEQFRVPSVVPINAYNPGMPIEVDFKITLEDIQNGINNPNRNSELKRQLAKSRN